MSRERRLGDGPRLQDLRPRRIPSSRLLAPPTRPWLPSYVANAGGCATDRGADDVLAIADRFLALTPDDRDALGARFDLLSTTGRHEEALATAELWTSLLPADEYAWAQRTECLRQLERDEDALATAELWSAAIPDSGLALWRRTELLHVLGRDEEALATAELWSALVPDDPRPWCARAEADPADHMEYDVSYWKAVVLSNLGRDEEALAHAERMDVLMEEDPCPEPTRLRLLWKLGRFDEARAGLVRTLEVGSGVARVMGWSDSERASTRHLLALIDYHQGRHEEARAEFARVRAEMRRDFGGAGEARSCHELGLTALEQGAYEQARAQFVRARELYRDTGNLAGRNAADAALMKIDFIEGTPL